MSTSARLSDRLLIVVAAVLFSTGGAVVKACHLSGWQVASFRSFLAAVVMLVLLPAARRRWNRRTFMVGIAYAATMISYVLANKLTTAAGTIFLQSAAPLYILLLGPWLLGERIGRREVPFMITLAVGMVLLLSCNQPESVTAPDPLRGNLVGLATGISWGLTIMGLRWLGREGSDNGGAAAAVACGNLLACFICLPLALPAYGSASDWLLIAYLGAFQIALAYLFLTRGVARVPALETSLLLLMEPVLSPVWAWLAHGETPGTGALLGGVLILSATTIKTWIDSARDAGRG